MKKRLAAIVLVAALLCVAAFALIYTRPRTIGQRYPFLDPTQCTQIRVSRPDAAAQGDSQWTVTFRFGDVPFPDGSTACGDLLTVENFYGDLYFYFDGIYTACAVKDQKQWISDVTDMLRFPSDPAK